MSISIQINHGRKVYEFCLVPPPYGDCFWRLERKGWFFWYQINSFNVHPNNRGIHKSRDCDPDATIEQITAWAEEEARKWCSAKHAPNYHFTMEQD